MNVFQAMRTHPTVAGDDIGWVPTPFGVARRAMRGHRPSSDVGDDEDDVGEDGEYLGDDGDDVGDDGVDDTDIGAVGRRLGRQIGHLDKRIARKKAKGKSTTTLQAHRARKAGKLARKLAKKGVDVTNPQEVQAAMSGYPNTYRPGPPFEGRSIPERIESYAQRNPPAGEEQPRALLIDDPLGVAVPKTTQLFPFAISLVPTTLAITAQSRGVAYAAFQLIGLQCNAQIARGQNAAGFPNQDLLLAALIADLHVDGFANTLYEPLPIDVVGVSGGMAGASQKPIASLRSNDVIDKTNVVVATGSIEQQIANAVAFNVSLSIAAITRTIYDPAAGIRPAGRR
jgi:hypothetical protein